METRISVDVGVWEEEAVQVGAGEHLETFWESHIGLYCKMIPLACLPAHTQIHKCNCLLEMLQY